MSLTSINSSIGASDQPLNLVIAGDYETLQAQTGIYLQDTGAGLSITTTGEGTDDAVVTATTLGDWNVGSLGVESGDLAVNVGGSSFEADSLNGNSVLVSVADPSGSAHIGVISVDNSLNTQVGAFTLDDLQTDSTGPLNIVSTGVNGGQGQSVRITSDVNNHIILDDLATEEGILNFPGSHHLDITDGAIVSSLHLETEFLDFNFIRNRLRPEACRCDSFVAS